MLLSMTGFSSKNITIPITEGKSIPLFIEMKSLNTRFFEASVRLPGGLGSLETEVMALLKEKLIRGRIYLLVQGGAEAVLEPMVPSFKVAEVIVNALKRIKSHCKLPGSIQISDLVHYPTIFITEKAPVSAAVKKGLLKGIADVADGLMLARKREGADLQKDIEKQFSVCKKDIEQIRRINERVMKEQKKQIVTVSAKAQKGDEEARIKLEELYAMLNKLDIGEEITRFRSHLTSAELLLRDRKNVEKGKRFDFILQELLRETNTIASKCSNYPISEKAVDIKVALEKAREQVQNVL